MAQIQLKKPVIESRGMSEWKARPTTKSKVKSFVRTVFRGGKVIAKKAYDVATSEKTHAWAARVGDNARVGMGTAPPKKRSKAKSQKKKLTVKKKPVRYKKKQSVKKKRYAKRKM